MRKKYEVEDIFYKSSGLIRKRGYHNTGINEILKENQIPKGSFYNFFKSKEDFMIQLLEYYGEASLKNIISVFGDKSLKPVERIEKFYTFIANVNEQEGCTAGCLVNNTTSEVAGMNLNIAKTSDEQFHKWTTYIAQTIQEGQEQGEIIDSYPPQELAEFLHQNIFGALTRMKATRNRQPLDIALKMTLDFLKK